MRRRGSAFWSGPGLLLGCLGLLVVGAGLGVAAAFGPPLVDGLVMMLVGLAVIWGRAGVGDYWYARAQRSYIWPRDPDRMKPNAELEGGIGVIFAIVLGVGLIIGGIGVASGE